MDDVSKPPSLRRGPSAFDHAAEQGQGPRNQPARSSAVAVVDTPALNGAQNDDRSPARRSFDELMESRRANSGAVWRAFLGPLLSRTEVQELIGAESAGEIDALVAEQRLLALPTHEGDVVYPAFQFRADGTPHPVIGRVIEILSPVVESPYMIASWLRSKKADLGGRTPLEWLEKGRDPRRVVVEARLSASHLAHS
jgi:hypothetical protein